jgi:hypothetical protein
MAKQSKRLEIVLDSILQSIYNDVYESEDTEIVGSANIKYKSDFIGEVNYVVSKEILVIGSTGSWEYPPDGDEVEFKLESATVKVIYGKSDQELVNVKNLLNELLFKQEGKIFEY